MLDRRIVLAGILASAVPFGASAQTSRMPVVATFSILADVVSTIGGERIALTTLVGPGADAHVYAPTPSDAKAVAEARLLIANGFGFESWLKRLMQSSASKATLIEAGADAKTIQAKAAHAHGHSHGAAGAADPHVWQSVANVKGYATRIRDALSAADPEGIAIYGRNAATYIAELDALDADIRAAIARIPPERRKIITSHDAFGYFQREYGVQFLAPRGVSTETEATAKDVARLIQQIRKEKVPAVFMENVSDQRLIQQIARESGAKVGGTLYSDGLSGSDGPAPTYIRMMRHNIRVMSEALQPTS